MPALPITWIPLTMSVLGSVTLPFLPIAGSPERRQRQLERVQSVKAAREAAMDAAYTSENADQLVDAIFRHVSRLYMKQSPYRESGSRYNSKLASTVVAEVLRKTPWLPHESALTPFNPSRAKFSWFVNHLARSRHLDLVEKHWAAKTKMDLENQMPEHETESLTDITVLDAISDERLDVLREFLATLTPDQRELADKEELVPADRNKWRTITRKAAKYGRHSPQDAPQGVDRPQRDRTWSMRCSALYEVKAEYGVLTTAAAIFRLYGLGNRTQRAEGWHWEPTRDMRAVDKWAVDGKSWTKQTPTTHDYEQMIDSN